MQPAKFFRVLGACICIALLPVSGMGAASLARLIPVKGKIRVDGTSNIDTWQVESKSVTGFLEVGPDFPLHPGQKTSLGPVEARGKVSVDALSLKSVEKDGKPFSNKMDEIMHEALRAGQNPQITFRLRQLVLRVPAKASSGTHELDAHGQLVVAGVANEITFPVNVLALPAGQVKIWGGTGIKMTDFHIEPPSPTITLGLIKTDDEVKVSFEWVLAPR